MREEFIEILVCPVCRNTLSFQGTKSNGRLQEGAFGCISCSRIFKVKDQIPDFVMDDLSKEMLTEKRILEVLDLDEETLKSWVEERKTYPRTISNEVEEANALMVSDICSKVSGFPFALDIASGRGRLLKNIAKTHSNIRLLGTDIDENMLRGARETLRNENLYQQVSLLLCDVRRLPFKSSSTPCIVSFAGFSNVQNAAEALSEARRVLSSEGLLLFSALFLEEGSRSLEYAGRLALADVASRDHLKESLRKAELKLLTLDEIFSGVYPGYNRDLLPFRGDWFSENLIIATTENPGRSRLLP